MDEADLLNLATQAEDESLELAEKTGELEPNGDGAGVEVKPPDEALVPRAVAPRSVPRGSKLKHPALVFNQELSWIDFNWRVLHLAQDERTPLLERVRFAAITASNLDEFTQKRVGGLMRQEAAGVRKLSPDGRTPSEQLELIHAAVSIMHETMTETWEKQFAACC